MAYSSQNRGVTRVSSSTKYIKTQTRPTHPCIPTIITDFNENNDKCYGGVSRWEGGAGWPPPAGRIPSSPASASCPAGASTHNRG